MTFFLTLFMTIWCRRENVRRDAVAAQQQGAGAPPQEPMSEEQRRLDCELADDAPWFRYTT